MVAPRQPGLLDYSEGEPTLVAAPSFERIQLDDTAWVDVARHWMHGTDTLFDLLVDTAPWTQGRRFLYDQWRDDPRLGTSYRDDRLAPHPIIRLARLQLERRYRVSLTGPALLYYRDGTDSVAPHADRELRHLDDTLIAILTLGSTRPFTIGPKPRGGRRERLSVTHNLNPAPGDLLVMGGSAQRGWLHSVPKVTGGGPRISITWRWTSRRGRPEVGSNWGAPRRYGERAR